MVKAIFSSTYGLPVAKEKFGSQFKALLPFFSVGGKLFLRQHADVKITTYLKICQMYAELDTHGIPMPKG